jgi:hypothetical protein
MKRDVPHFRIGLLLTEAGIIAPVQLDAAIQQGEQKGEPFLKVLVGAGYLKQHELQAVIRAQSLIWSGLLDVERAIAALSIVHSSDVTIDEGLRSVGWVRPSQGSSDETEAHPVQVRTKPAEPSSNGSLCQYCGFALERGLNICTFCTGANLRNSAAKIQIDPPWQKQAASNDQGRISATTPARDPLLMTFFSGCCFPGLGQILMGQVAKGAVVGVIALLIMFITNGMAALVLLPIAALDAYLVADKLRDGRTVGPWEFF